MAVTREFDCFLDPVLRPQKEVRPDSWILFSCTVVSMKIKGFPQLDESLTIIVNLTKLIYSTVHKQ